ncbi:hypothetical protein V5O48_006595 [Marasmius crinis-equi]|uniref:Uncharacterized protein n=1 Tax=Marasmius crinis-equi TaxID=585013 RepID=A0ABR3FJ46_9AGAR
MNQISESYSNATPTNSSFTTSSGGPSTPVTSFDDSSSHRRTIARASVFDAFFQLGGFEENSPLADWVFNEERSANLSGDSLPHSGESSPLGFREQSGSRFRERLGSDSPVFILNNWKDDDTKQDNRPKKNKPRSKVPPPSKAGFTTNKRQSAVQFSNTSAAASHDRTAAPRRPFSLFRTRTSRSSKFEENDDPVNVSPKSKKKPQYTRSQTHPPLPLNSHHYVDSDSLSPSRPSMGTLHDWEKVDPLSTLDFQTLASTDNPFLHGDPHPTVGRSSTADTAPIPFPTSRTSTSTPPPTFMQRLSFVVTRPFRLSQGSRDHDSPTRHKQANRFSLRRTKSSMPDTAARPFFTSSPASTVHMHRLKPSISHT